MLRSASQTYACLCILGKEGHFPCMVTVLLALPHLPSFSDTFDIPERFRKPPTRLRASRPNSTSEEGRCKDMTQRTADDTLALLLGSLCLELRVYPSIRMHKETLGPSSAAYKNGAMSARGLPHACQRPRAFWEVLELRWPRRPQQAV